MTVDGHTQYHASDWAPCASSGSLGAMAGDVFDLDAEGIALSGATIRGLGEYAQGNGAAKKLYVKATDLELVTNYEVFQAAEELQRLNERLNSSELDKLVKSLMQIAHTEGGDEEEQEYDQDQQFYLNEQELRALSYIAGKYSSARILLDGYDEESMTIPRSAVIEAYLATREDGGDLGTVPLAGGTLRKKIEQLWEEADAFEVVEELLES